MFEGINVRRPTEMICLFYLHASVSFHEVDNIVTDQRTADVGICLSQITWSTLCSDNIQSLKSALDHKQSSVLQFASKKLIFSPVKLEHLRKYELILRSTWVKMKLVFHNATTASKSCLIDQVLLKIGCSYKSHTSYSTSDLSDHEKLWKQ